MIRKLRRLLLTRHLKSSTQIIFTCLLFGLACVALEYRLKFIQFSLKSKGLNYNQDVNEFDKSITSQKIIRQTSQEDLNINLVTDINDINIVKNISSTNSTWNIKSIIPESAVSNKSTATNIIAEPAQKSTFPAEKLNSTLKTEDIVEILEDGDTEKEEFMAKMDKRMEKRRNDLKETCKRLGINPNNETFQPWHRTQPMPKAWFYSSTKYPLIYCEIPKSGCSNWKKVLMVLNGVANSTDGIKQGQAHASPIGMVRTSPTLRLKSIYEKSLKMMVVREPFERLVSAYQDKVASKPPSYQATFGMFSDGVAKKYGDRWKNPTYEDENGIKNILTCDKHEAKLECTQPYHVIEIVSAEYGRENWETCGVPNVPDSIFKDCWSTSSHYVTSQLCNGKPLCRVSANQVQFGVVATCPNIPKYLKVRYRCKSISHMKSITVCQNQRQIISCPVGTLISVGTAFYGRIDQKVCKDSGPIYNLECQSATATAVVSTACHLRQNCSVEASVRWIQSDDCPATSKYLTVWFACKSSSNNLERKDSIASSDEVAEQLRKIRSIFNTTDNDRKSSELVQAVSQLINITKKQPLVLAPKEIRDKIVQANKEIGAETKHDIDEGLPPPAIYIQPKYVPRHYDLQASFDEFSSYIIDPDNADVTKDSIDYGNAGLKSTSVRHWQHHTTLCHPCHFHYDVIAHVETLTEDARYVLERIGAPKSLEFPGGYDSSGKRATDKEKVIKQFSKLSLEKIHRLYEFYKTDFELFDYPLPQLLSSGVDSK